MRSRTRIAYPFVQEPITLMDDEGPYTMLAWRPGVIEPPLEMRSYGDGWADFIRWCHGIGACVLTEIEKVVLPKPYQPRIFYVRTWVDPDGKAFGKTTLRVCTETKFLAMLQGYFYPYDVVPVGYGTVETNRPVETGVI